MDNDENKCRWCGRDTKEMEYESMGSDECWICFELYGEIQAMLPAAKKMIKEIESK